MCEWQDAYDRGYSDAKSESVKAWNTRAVDAGRVEKIIARSRLAKLNNIKEVLEWIKCASTKQDVVDKIVELKAELFDDIKESAKAIAKELSK